MDLPCIAYGTSHATCTGGGDAVVRCTLPARHSLLPLRPESEYTPSVSFTLKFPLEPAVTSVALPPEFTNVTVPAVGRGDPGAGPPTITDRKSTRLNSSHLGISYAV